MPLNAPRAMLAYLALCICMLTWPCMPYSVCLHAHTCMHTCDCAPLFVGRKEVASILCEGRREHFLSSQTAEPTSWGRRGSGLDVSCLLGFTLLNFLSVLANIIILQVKMSLRGKVKQSERKDQVRAKRNAGTKADFGSLYTRRQSESRQYLIVWLLILCVKSGSKTSAKELPIFTYPARMWHKRDC